MKFSKIHIAIFALLLNCLLFQIVESSPADKLRRSNSPIAGRYIVVLNDDIVGGQLLTDQVESLSAELSRSYGGIIDKLYNSAIRGYSIEMSPKQAESLSRDSRVKYVEEDTRISAAATQSPATWGLDRIDQRSLPLQGNYVYTATGNGVNAYIIDSGIRYTHEDFGGRAQFGFDAFADGQAGNDCYGHGTHVAGTVGSTTYGVAKNVNLFSVRVLDCGGAGDLSGLMAAIDWITANRIEPAVANISLTAGGVSTALDQAITNSIASGVTYTVASANFASDACGYSPSGVPNAITVGASGDADQRAPFSNYGTCVDLFAPGYAIESTGIASDTAIAIKHGTSMAAPHAAGVAALFLEQNPAATPAQVDAAIKSGATSSILTNTGEGSPNLLLFSLVPEGPEPITNVSPSEGTIYNGYPNTITWNNNGGYHDNVTIELSTDGGLTYPAVVASNLPNTGSHTWTVTAAPTSEARIRVRQYNEMAPSGTSSGNFEISYVPSAIYVTVSGRVTRSNGSGVAGASVSLTDTLGRTMSAQAGTFGYFVIENVLAGESYFASASQKRFRFQGRVLTVSDNVVDLDFVANQ